MKNNPFSLGLIGTMVFAHQPVMDMAPRWNGGYGFQVRYESFGSDRTIHEQNILSSYFQQTYWLEGVYTWHRAKRITFKLPYHMIERQDADLVAKSKSFGDLILAVPLKKYSNFKRRTQNFGFTPQIRIPSNTKEDVLEWKDDSQTEPTTSEIDTEVARLQAISDGNAYQRTRATAYAELKEQLDLLYHDMTADKGDKTGTWYASVKAVKDATPKP